MFRRHGSLVVSLVIIASFFYIQQGVLAVQVPPVVFVAPHNAGFYVELSAQLAVSGITQVVHIESPEELLRHVSSDEWRSLLVAYLSKHQLHNGQRVTVNMNLAGEWLVQCDFMSAQRRMVLGIPLHPDRMSRTDWLALPGVGERMAQKIVANEAQYGKFYTYEALGRVSGIASKTLERWRDYF